MKTKNTILFFIMKRLIIFLFFIPTSLYSQNCSCESSLNWLIKTIEENDAGFQYAIDQKGKHAYIDHNKSFYKKVKNIKKLEDCSTILNAWTKFFRSAHIGVGLSRPQKALSKDEIIDKYANSEIFVISENEFSEYLKKIDEPTFEGIWQTGIYKIGIIKDKSTTKESYIGFIIEADNVYWKKNQIKLKIYKSEGKYKSNFSSNDHTEIMFDDVALVDKNYITFGPVTLKRINSKYKTDLDVESYFDLLDSSNATLKELSKETMLLRIPSFAFFGKKHLDSILKSNHEKIMSHENLIIDVRNNTGGSGGSDQTYQSIIPYIYTNPINIVDVQFLSTPLNNKRMEDMINTPNLPESNKDWARNVLKKLNSNLGGFVNINNSITSTIIRDKIYEYPKNVAILINDKNVSTTEQFLIDVKQSQKVKLFGTKTSGAIDIAGMYSIQFPCEDLRLIYGISKSHRIPDYQIDGYGLQPDYFIHESIPEYKWIEYTKKILETSK